MSGVVSQSITGTACSNNIIVHYSNSTDMDVVKKIKNYTYNERHCLGEGSFGRVFEGRSDAGMQVAIKKVEQRMISKDAYLRSSLESEINIMKKLNHRNIVRLHDTVMTSNSIYLVMEFCAGGDLKRYCRNRRLSEEEATGILKQVCGGFQEIVKKGIIHRDLKPANILVHEGMFKICDFGFAKFFGEASQMARTCVGTPIYMSPQVLHHQSYTNKTDIWSLGTLYYELIFGKLPFQGPSEEELYLHILKNPLVIPPSSKQTQNLLRGMLVPEEAKRYNWNNLFDIFGLGQVPDIAPRQPKREEAKNGFYHQRSANELLPDFEHRDKNKGMANKMGNIDARMGNVDGRIGNVDGRMGNVNGRMGNVDGRMGEMQHLRQEMAKEGFKEEAMGLKVSVGPHQRKPKNPLAFQNVEPPNRALRQNPVQIPREEAKKAGEGFEEDWQEEIGNKVPASGPREENPRFLYFVLIELIVNPLPECPSYPQLVSALYHKTTEDYTRLIEKEEKGLYKKVLQSELEEVKGIGEEIPPYAGEDYQRIAEAVMRQGSALKAESTIWVQRLAANMQTYMR